MTGAGDTEVTIPCPTCGADLAAGVSFCPACGADQELAAVRSHLRPRVPWSGLLVVLLLLAAAALLWVRYNAVGPAGDLPRTFAWMLLGDGGRGAEVATLSRAYESSRALLRYCIAEGTPDTLDDLDWSAVAGYSNANWRGFVSLVQWAASRDAIHGRLAHLLAVDGRDGWGRGWRATLAPWPLMRRPEGFFPGILAAGDAPPRDRPLLHLTLSSAGADGDHGSADDIVFEALFPAPLPIRVARSGELDRREYELERGLVWVRWHGTDRDLVDSRVRAELLLTAAHGE